MGNSLRSETVIQLKVLDPIINRFLRNLPQSNSALVESCAVLRWFDENTLTDFLGIENASALMAELAEMSFVESRNYGLAFHDSVRNSVCQGLAFHSPSLYRDLHRRAADYCRRRAFNSLYGMRQQWVVEMVYHLIRASEEEGINLLRSLVSNAKNLSRRDFAVALLETTDDLPLRNTSKTWVEDSKFTLLQPVRGFN